MGGGGGGGGVPFLIEPRVAVKASTPCVGLGATFSTVVFFSYCTSAQTPELRLCVCSCFPVDNLVCSVLARTRTAIRL